MKLTVIALAVAMITGCGPSNAEIEAKARLKEEQKAERVLAHREQEAKHVAHLAKLDEILSTLGKDEVIALFAQCRELIGSSHPVGDHGMPSALISKYSPDSLIAEGGRFWIETPEERWDRFAKQANYLNRSVQDRLEFIWSTWHMKDRKRVVITDRCVMNSTLTRMKLQSTITPFYHDGHFEGK